MKALQALADKPYVQAWARAGRPDDSYPLYVCPSKMVVAIIRGMVRRAELLDDPNQRRASLAVALGAADWLISVSEKPDARLANWLPTYRGTGAAAGKCAGLVMFICPAAVGRAYPSLYRATDKPRFLDAAALPTPPFTERPDAPIVQQNRA
jgi:hypothetical protein